MLLFTLILVEIGDAIPVFPTQTTIAIVIPLLLLCIVIAGGAGLLCYVKWGDQLIHTSILTSLSPNLEQSSGVSEDKDSTTSIVINTVGAIG